MDQHIRVVISVESNERVSFITKYGWVESKSITIDAIDLEQAKEKTVDFLNDLEPAPFQNCSSNEEFVAEAENHMTDLTAAIEELEFVEDGKFELQCVFPMQVSIKFTDYYQVDFGE